VPLLHKLLIGVKESGGWKVEGGKKARISGDSNPHNRTDLDPHASTNTEFTLDLPKELITELETRDPDLLESLKDAHFLKNIPPIDCIAVTEGPGSVLSGIFQ
jgi:hypothetical protein